MHSMTTNNNNTMNNDNNEYLIKANFTKGPMAGNLILLEWIGPLEVGKSVEMGEHQFTVLSCTLNPL